MALEQQETVPVSLTNSGPTSVTISAANSSAPAFAVADFSLPFILAAGESVNLSLTFKPTVSGWAKGTISFISNASNGTLDVGMGGVGVPSVGMTPSPSRLSFGSVAVGSTATLPIVLTNSGTTTIRVTQGEMTGSGFTTSGLSLPVVVRPKQTLSFDVIFAPQTGGAARGTLVLPNGEITIPLSGKGTSAGGQLSMAPVPLNFGDVTVGSTATQAVTVIATGASVTISSADTSSPFALSGASFPLTIAAGANALLNVAFTPQAGGTASGSLSLVSNASNSPGPELLTGMGALASYSVDLSWNNVPDVAGYNVYRSSTANGTYARINSTLDANTAYTDGSVTSGTYYYAATSVTSSGHESARSTPPAEAVVP